MFATRRAHRSTEEVLVQRQEKAQDTNLKHHYSKRLSLCFVLCDTKLQRVADIHKLLHKGRKAAHA